MLLTMRSQLASRQSQSPAVMTNNNINNVCHANYYCRAALGMASLEPETGKAAWPIGFDANGWCVGQAEV